MSKSKLRTKHISFPDEIGSKLKDFSKGRGSESAVIQRGLELLFSVEAENAKEEAHFRKIIEAKFLVPKNIPVRSFFSFLYMLANKYPTQSSKQFWTETIYTSPDDKTHKQIIDELRAEYKKFGNGNGK